MDKLHVANFKLAGQTQLYNDEQYALEHACIVRCNVLMFAFAYILKLLFKVIIL